MERQIKHLYFIQGIVNRLAANSFRIRDGAWYNGVQHTEA